MKKIIVGALSAALVLSMSLTAFAAAGKTDEGLNVTDNNKSEQNVDVKITGADTTTKVYSVDVEWDSTDFTYTVNSADGTWDPATHTYGGDQAADGTWTDASSDTITNDATVHAIVTNHSNAPVGVAAAIDNADSATKLGVTADVSVNKPQIATGDGLTYDNADSADVSITVSGTPTTSTDFTIGKVTITLSEVQ